jgi:hypothetical protein
LIRLLRDEIIQFEHRLKIAVADAPLVRDGIDGRWRRCHAVIAVRPGGLIAWWDDGQGLSPGMVGGDRARSIAAAVWPELGCYQPEMPMSQNL